MVGTATGTAADGRADHCGHLLNLSAGHEAVLGQVVDDGVYRHHAEVHLHDLHDRAPAHHGCADAETNDGVLCQGRVDDPVGAVLVIQVAGDAIGTAQDAHILPQQDDLVVPGQFLIHRQTEGLHICHGFCFHCSTLLSVFSSPHICDPLPPQAENRGPPRRRPRPRPAPARPGPRSP